MWQSPGTPALAEHSKTSQGLQGLLQTHEEEITRYGHLIQQCIAETRLT